MACGRETDDVLPRLLEAVRDKCKAKLTGSYAAGRARLCSDIDLVVGSQALVRKAIQIFEEFNVSWESILIGQCGSVDESLSIPVEVMWSAWLKPIPKPQRENTVVVAGVEFQTW